MDRIKADEHEFLDIVRRKVRQDLLKFLSRGQITFLGPKQGVAIGIDQIELPRLKFRELPFTTETGEGGIDAGVGSGPGEPGDDLGPLLPEDGEGDGEGDGKEEGGQKKSAGAGRGKGKKIVELEISAREFSEIFAETLQLPRIKPKGNKTIKTIEKKYTDIRSSGPDSLRHKKRTYKNALKRAISEGFYDPKKPKVVPMREDIRFKAPKEVIKPQHSAVIFYMMDVSGSMTQDDRDIVRNFCRICNFWLGNNYDDLETVWIIHDDGADEISEAEFFRTQKNGGTVISSAHELMLEIIEKRYQPSHWNIYPFYFSDGFNWEGDDLYCRDLLMEKILPIVNQYSYGEVHADREWYQPKKNVPFSPSGSYGILLEDLQNKINKERQELFIECLNLYSMEEVMEAVRKSFKAGR